eukprot:TCALIF_06494-PA protein Name:"Protein of unknown function" AED:0.14 eAED:0.14 QI:250/0.66/1/1/1/1/4/54/290
MIDRVCARSGGIFIIPLLFLFLAILVMGQVVICDPQPWPNSFTRLRPIPKQRQLLMQEYQTLILRQANGNGTKVERATSRNCHALEESKPEDKIVLTPILVQGRLISRSTGFNSLYSVAFRVLKVLKGKLPRKLRRHVKLMYQQEDEDEKVNPLCEFPIKFDVKANRKYLIFIKRLGPARYVAIAKPEIWTKDVRRIAKKTLCEGCGEACGPYGHDIHFREICAAWKQPPITEMSRHEFTEWKSVERQIVDLRRAQEEFQYRRFRLQTPKLEAMALTQESHLAERGKHLA